MLIVLPARPRRAWVRAFGLAIGLWGGLAVGVLAPLAGPTRALAAALVVVAAGLAAAWRPAEVRLAYRVWNKAARTYARAVRHAALVVAYGVVAAAGGAGSSLRLHRPGPDESLWSPRPTLPVEAYGSQSDRPGGRAWRGHPWAGVAAWALGTRNAWATLLVPFLLIVVATESQEQEEEFPAGIYTLF
jgi:hypothetical protein